jgi:hypothetical protein
MAQLLLTVHPVTVHSPLQVALMEQAKEVV